MTTDDTMTLRNSIALEPIASQWLKIDLYCLRNILIHFWSKLKKN